MYKIMFYGGMVGTVLMFIITVFIFIKGNVLEDIKDLLGVKSTRKTLNINRSSNATSGIKPINTNEISKPMGIKLDEIISKGLACEEGTEVLKTVDENQENTIILSNEEETELLSEECETELLISECETELLVDEDETTILGFDEETELLNEFRREVDIVIVNSKVII